MEFEGSASVTVDADKIRIKVLGDILLIAAAGSSTLRIFEMEKAQKNASEIASLNVGEQIEDIEFAIRTALRS